MTSLLRKTRQTWRRFWADANGAVLFYITATLPALVGFSLLAIDASRLSSLHTSLQKAVDALAIAGAGELTRTPGSMARAEVAIANIVKNVQFFGEGTRLIDNTNVTVRFLDRLPPTDDIPIGNGGGSGSTAWQILTVGNVSHDQIARFVEVKVDTYNLNAIFPASFLGGPNTALTNAVAVAGNDQVVCGLSPMFICNPWESDNTTTNSLDPSGILAAVGNDVQRRRLIAARLGPTANNGPGETKAFWFPGDFGFLDMGSGAKDLAEAIGGVNNDSCFVKNGVDTEPGQMEGPVKAAINVRFGLYNNPFFNNESNNGEYSPGANVRAGRQWQSTPAPDGSPTSCDEYEPDTVATAQALPRSGGSWRVEPQANVENGPWNASVTNYWTNNGLTGSSSPAVPSVASRWELYNHEITEGVTNHAAANGETGNPMECYSGSTAPAPERRLIGVAVINCGAAGQLSGAEDNVPVAVFAEMLISEPVAKANNSNIYLELVNVVQQGNGIIVDNLDMVQLYR